MARRLWRMWRIRNIANWAFDLAAWRRMPLTAASQIVCSQGNAKSGFFGWFVDSFALLACLHFVPLPIRPASRFFPPLMFFKRVHAAD